MKTITTLNNINRAARNTTMGNPNWNLETDQGVFKLETNGGLGYALDNTEYQNMVGQRVIITHTKSMRFSNIELVQPYPAGTNIRDISKFDRSTKVQFRCSDHPLNIWESKEPSCSTWLSFNGNLWGEPQEPACNCSGTYVTTAPYTR